MTNSGTNNVSVINTATDIVIDTFGVGVSPNGIAFSPDGTLGYTANGSSQDVTVFRTSDNTVIDTISNGGLPSPRGIDVTPDGQFIYVTNILDDSVSVMRTSDNTLVTVITQRIFGRPDREWKIYCRRSSSSTIPNTYTRLVGCDRYGGYFGHSRIYSSKKKESSGQRPLANEKI